MMATVGSCIGWLQKLLKQLKSEVVVRMAPPYHDHPTYIEPIAEKLKERMSTSSLVITVFLNGICAKPIPLVNTV